jgi:hypothetical protein
VDGNGDIQRYCVETLGTIATGAACGFDFFPALDGVTCFNDADCTAAYPGSTCDIANRTCVQPLAEACRSGNCGFDSGLCTTSCTADVDCPADFVCEATPLLEDDNGTPDTNTDDTFVFGGTCAHRPGSRTVCDQDSDCTGPEFCRALRAADGTIGGVCALTSNAAFAAIGEACGVVDDAVVQCQSGMCDGPPDGTPGLCTNMCAVDGDCRNGTTCQDIPADRLQEPNNTFKVCR